MKRKNTYYRLITILLFFTTAISFYAQTFEVVPLVENGATDKRINFIYLSEGYTAGELSQFETDAASIAEAQFGYSPYKEYQNFFNIYLIKVPSAETGTDHPQNTSDSDCTSVPVMQADTYFDSTFDSYGIHRLLTADTGKITDVMMENTPYFDEALLIVNTPYYGGSGGSYAVGSTHAESVAIMTHETGHSFGHLKDEYWVGAYYAAEAANMTQESDPELIKWKNWIGDEGIGIFPYGDNPPESEWFHPHQSCLMRTLDGVFCAVCREALIDEIYTLVSPIDSFFPEENNTIPVEGEDIDFQVNLIHPDPDTLTIQWYLDGEPVAEAQENWTYTPEPDDEENHQVAVVVQDETPLSRTYVFAGGYVFNVFWVITNNSSVEDQAVERFIYKAYPNPVRDVLHFDYTLFEATEEVQLTFYNALGQEVMHKTLVLETGQWHQEWDISSWQAGMYYLQVRKGNYTKTWAFVKI